MQNRKSNPYDTMVITRLHNTSFTLREFDATLNTFKRKVPDPSGITTLLIKHIPRNMKQYVLYIFYNAISAGYIPDNLKLAHIIVQYTVKPYRLISLLEIYGKILSKILSNRLFECLAIYDTIEH